MFTIFVIHYSYYKNRVCVKGYQNKKTYFYRPPTCTVLLTSSYDWKILERDNTTLLGRVFVFVPRKIHSDHLALFRRTLGILFLACDGRGRGDQNDQRFFCPLRECFTHMETSQLPMMDCKIWIYIWEVRVFQCVTIVIEDIGLYGYLQGHTYTCCNLLWVVELSLPVLMTCVCRSRYLHVRRTL